MSGINQETFTNKDKARVIEALQNKYDLKNNLNLARSSYYFEKKHRDGSEKHTDLRNHVIKTFKYRLNRTDTEEFMLRHDVFMEGYQ